MKDEIDAFNGPAMTPDLRTLARNEHGDDYEVRLLNVVGELNGSRKLNSFDD